MLRSFDSRTPQRIEVSSICVLFCEVACVPCVLKVYTVQMLNCLRGDKNCTNGNITKKREQVLKLNEHTSYLFAVRLCIYCSGCCVNNFHYSSSWRKLWTRKHIHTYKQPHSRILPHECDTIKTLEQRFIFSSPFFHHCRVEHLYFAFSFRIKLNENTTFPWTHSHR